MSQADLLDQDPVFQLKGSMLAVTILELAHNDLARLERQLADKVAQAPNFFRDTPLVMALDKLPEGEGRLDLPALLEVCRRHGLRTLAIRAGREEDIAAAQALDLPVLPPSGARERPLDIKDSAPRKPAEEPSPSAGEARPELRGRALAGVKGDATARIFCQQLAAELVSIAGNYKVAEDLRRSPQWGKAVHVSLSGDVLNITRL